MGAKANLQEENSMAMSVSARFSDHSCNIREMFVRELSKILLMGLLWKLTSGRAKMRKGKAVDDALQMRLASSPVKRLGTSHKAMTPVSFLHFGHVFLDFAQGAKLGAPHVLSMRRHANPCNASLNLPIAVRRLQGTQT